MVVSGFSGFKMMCNTSQVVDLHHIYLSTFTFVSVKANHTAKSKITVGGNCESA